MEAGRILCSLNCLVQTFSRNTNFKDAGEGSKGSVIVTGNWKKRDPWYEMENSATLFLVVTW